MKIRKNIIGFAVTVILLCFIGPWKVFSTEKITFEASNNTTQKVRFVILDSNNKTYWLDVGSGQQYVTFIYGLQTINFHTYGSDCHMKLDIPPYLNVRKSERDFVQSCPNGGRFRFSISTSELPDKEYNISVSDMK